MGYGSNGSGVSVMSGGGGGCVGGICVGMLRVGVGDRMRVGEAVGGGPNVGEGVFGNTVIGNGVMLGNATVGCVGRRGRADTGGEGRHRDRRGWRALLWRGSPQEDAHAVNGIVITIIVTSSICPVAVVQSPQ